MSPTILHPAVAGWELVWRPMLDPLHIAGLSVVLIGLAVLAYGRAGRGRPGWAVVLLAMRLVAIAVLAGLLMGPSASVPQPQQNAKPGLTVLLDASGSMLTEDAADGSRLDTLRNRWLDDRQLDHLAERFDLRMLSFAESVRSLPPAQLNESAAELVRGRSTRYAEALSDVLLDLPDPGTGDGDEPQRTPPMLLVLGDGRDTAGQSLASAAQLARRRGVPIHTVAVGRPNPPKDLALTAQPLQDYLMVGEEGRVLVELRQAGLENASATIRLSREEGGEEQQRRVEFDGRGRVTVELPIEPSEPGRHAYTASVEPVEGEAVTENNRHTVFVEASEQRMRVLLLEGEPYWDTRFLAQALREDRRIELTQITQVSPGKRTRVTTRRDASEDPPRVPENLQQWAEHDVVILGRGVERLLTPDAAAALDRFVSESGGHLALARGRPYEPGTAAGRAVGEALSGAEPVVWDRGRGAMRRMPITLSPAGRSSGLFALTGPGGDAGALIEALPPLELIPEIERMKPGAVMLARAGRGPVADGSIESPSAPAMVSMRYGRGRVFAVLGQGLWRWSFLPPDRSEHRGVFEAFWSNAVRWLAMGGRFEPGQQIGMELSRSSLRLGDPVQIDVSTRVPPPEGFGPKLTVTDPGNESHRLDLSEIGQGPGRLRAELSPRRTGVWTLTLQSDTLEPAEQTRRFSVYDVNTERLRSGARPDVLRRLAERTGGRFFRAEEPADLAEQMERQHAARLAPPRVEYLWDHGLLLALLLFWIGLEWVGRRIAGMV